MNVELVLPGQWMLSWSRNLLTDSVLCHTINFIRLQLVGVELGVYIHYHMLFYITSCCPCVQFQYYVQQNVYSLDHSVYMSCTVWCSSNESRTCANKYIPVKIWLLLPFQE